MIVDNGLNWTRSLLGGRTATALTYIAYGSSTTVSTVGMTSLQSEINRSTLGTTYIDSTVNVSRFRLTPPFYDLPAGNSVGELGLCDATGGVGLFNRVTFDPVTRATTKQLRFDQFIQTRRE